MDDYARGVHRLRCVGEQAKGAISAENQAVDGGLVRPAVTALGMAS